MLLKDLLQKPLQNYLYLERYVNKGSPSGFSRRYTTSKPYDPVRGAASFPLPCFRLSSTHVEVFGDRGSDVIRNWLQEDSVLFAIHPDMIPIFSNDYGIKIFRRHNIYTNITVSPTANGRTVYSHDEKFPGFIKLHYEGILGRVMRGLPRIKAIAGVEISQELEVISSLKSFPSRMAILPERAALINDTGCPNLETIGLILRSPTPYPVQNTGAMIPFFSLFSKDMSAPDHPELLLQLLEMQDDAEECLFEWIIRPMLRTFCFLVFNRGLLPELNAQNVLLELDPSGSPKRIVLRDFQGFEKDLSIRKRLNLPCKFKSAPYKCISEEEDSDIYYKRHSFGYDFKLSEYVIDPLINLFCSHYKQNRALLQQRVASEFQKTAGPSAYDYFKPEDLCFFHKRELLTNRRRYFHLTPPRYRIPHGGAKT